MSPPGSGSAPGPDALSRLQRLELTLRQEWRVNRVIIRGIGAVKLDYGIPSAREAAEGLPPGPGILDGKLAFNAASDALHDLAWDSSKYELSGQLLREGVERSLALEWLSKEGARAEIARHITQHKERIGQIEARLASHRAELAGLAETDARTQIEVEGKEPPHPPYKRMDEIRSEMRRLQEDLELEKRLLKAGEDDARKLDARLQKESERTEEFIKKKSKEAAKRL